MSVSKELGFETVSEVSSIKSVEVQYVKSKFFLIIRSVALAGLLILFLPFLLVALPFIAIYAVGSAIGSLVAPDKSDLLQKVKHARENEERIRWEALRSVETKLTPEVELKAKLLSLETKRRKIVRHVCNACEGRGCPFACPEIEKKVSDIDLESRSLDSVIDELSEGHIANPGAVASQIESELAVNAHSAEEFNQNVQKIVDHLKQKNPSDVATANRQFLYLLQQALRTRGYQALKENPNDATVKTVHDWAVAIWNGVKPFNAYLELGHSILLKRGYEPEDSPLTGKAIVDLLEASHRAASPHLYKDQNFLQKLHYSLKYPLQSLHRMFSEEGWFGKAAVWAGYTLDDSQTLVDNIPSIQGKTIAKVDGHEVTVNNCYGGTPTHGNVISHEFLALIQAVENNHYAKHLDPEIPSFILYTNFQSLNKKEGENPRSIAIMELNYRFPQSFCGITLSKDSRFYCNADDRQWDGAEAFGKEMMRYLMSGSSFSLHGRVDHEDGGFYFPGSHEFWEKTFKGIIAKANERFKEVPAELKLHASQSKLRSAYQEYVYSLLQSVIEMNLLALQIKRWTIGAPILMAIRSCKENVDRGCNENVKYLYTRLEDQYFEDEKEEGLGMMAGVFHSPPLLACDRMVHMNRTPQVFAFMKYVDRKDYQQDRDAILADLGVNNIYYSS